MVRVMNSKRTDYIAIDTNIFVHLLDSDRGNQIERLLFRLQKEGTRLICDKKGRIVGEYSQKIIQQFKVQEHPDYTDLIDYWLDRDADHLKISVNHVDSLYKQITKNLKADKKTIDRIFVYVAFKANRTLITNDRSGIIDKDSKTKDGERRLALLKIARLEKANSANIYDSQEAYDKIFKS